MKRLIIPMIAALALVATSCSSEEAEMTNSGEECVVTVSASLPMEMGTRSFSDGTTAEKLQYAVYETDGTYRSEGATTFDGGLTATVQLRLAVGKSYNIAFWASAVSSPYTFDTKSHKVTVSYDNAECNDESRDAFFYALNNLKVDGGVSENITLTRPFAQVNFGTSDSDKDGATKSGLTVQKSQMTVSTVYDTLDLLSGNVSGEQKDKTFSFVKVPMTETFPVKDYQYLAMSYILVPADKSVVDVTLTVDSKSNFEHTYTSLPVQRNYRTNVYGTLFTAPADFHVTKDPLYETPDYEYVKIYSQAAFEEEAAVAGSKIVLNGDDGESFVMPAKIADNVEIDANQNTIYTDNPVEGKNVQIKNAILRDGLDKNASRKKVSASDGVDYSVYTNLQINGDSAKIENCVIYSSYRAVDIAAGKSATISNCTFKRGMLAFRGVQLNEGSSVVLNNCEYERGCGSSYCIYSNGNCKVEANGCVFSGWMSGWQNGGVFNNCTFRYSTTYVPYAVCYGNTEFNNCKFEYVGVNYTTDGSTKSVYGKYGFNYRVSGRGPRIDFNNCTYTSTLVPEYDGKPVEPSIYLEGQGDDKTPAKNVYIDGECIFPLVSGEVEE